VPGENESLKTGITLVLAGTFLIAGFLNLRNLRNLRYLRY